jgi:hypothetical protein
LHHHDVGDKLQGIEMKGVASLGFGQDVGFFLLARECCCPRGRYVGRRIPARSDLFAEPVELDIDAF